MYAINLLRMLSIDWLIVA